MNLLVNVLSVMLLGIPAMIFHECGHIAVALLCGVKVKRVGLGRRGLYTVREPGLKWINVAVSSAGPMVNLLLAVALWNSMPLFAEVNLIAGAYNLLPFPNSDGSRIRTLLSQSDVVPQPIREVRA